MKESSICRFIAYFMYGLAIAVAVAVIVKGAYWHIATPFIFAVIGMGYRDTAEGKARTED